MSATWPALPLDDWRDTYETLHMWTQVAGKVCLALEPTSNQYWSIAFRVDARGLVTPLMPYQDRPFAIRFDFLDHRLEILCTDGGERHFDLKPMSVAEFYRRLRQELNEMGIQVKIWPVPVEVPNPIPFPKDTVHASYDAAKAGAFWHLLLSITPVLEQFRCGFVGKCSPVHFFWGSFDLAVTRFSGRPAPPRPEMGAMYAEAYSQEVISHGFWPGSGPVQEPAFYAYAVPQPDGLPQAKISPASAYYHQELKEFILPYEAVRTSADPEAALTSFLATTYDAAAELAGWDRADLERSS